ncbi:MAG: leucine-rich repeat domain-containing protein [Lachnospiraceae bacterium]|nr:leucine-rich repeat domain-containing protein [Ruminococcus sp.]MCM1274851.1 leucine-rich repeat domain-containing protein [Lachnospiraceae bacterium]
MENDELFEFEETEGGYELTKYRGRYGDGIYKVVIPRQYRGKPVVRIGIGAFRNAFRLEEVRIPPEVREIEAVAFTCCHQLCAVEFSEGLKKIDDGAFSYCEYNLISLTFPKSLEYIGGGAFYYCHNLEKVRFLNPDTVISTGAFIGCEKLPAEVRLMSSIGSTDITRPISREIYSDIRAMISEEDLYEFIDKYLLAEEFLHTDVFKLAVENDCLRNANEEDLEALFVLMFQYCGQLEEHLRAALYGGLIRSAELCDEIIEFAVKFNDTELTAWLLEYKKRKFGFGNTNYDI